MQNNNKGVTKDSGNSFARPYVNNQTFTKMYNTASALKHGTIFPELFLLDSLMYNKDLYSTPKKRNGGRR
ncbi:spore coat associated protein CotJA [Romboutsia sedimentorum]|uniref:Spore coat associated protein CotJA n=1 Tax=Romboutsia sedimentorum TaxID=1368474 RepID=A0ABT7E748_9FIRM|nr:spore coat associated protein CotJA [Romboutsia sedimentorum]MDK2562755.1 spore coat associated protein CotJA [Romboutsia sedimentorum]